MLVKIAKVLNIIFIISLFVMLIATATYMTKYNYFDSSNKDIQLVFNGTNNMLLYTLVVMAIALALCNIVSNGSRRKYHYSNLVVGTAAPAVAMILGIVSIVKIGNCMSLFAENYDELAAYDAQFNLGDYVYNNSGMVTSMILVIIVLVFLACYIGFVVYRFFVDNRNNCQKFEEVGEANE